MGRGGERESRKVGEAWGARRPREDGWKFWALGIKNVGDSCGPPTKTFGDSPPLPMKLRVSSLLSSSNANDIVVCVSVGSEEVEGVCMCGILVVVLCVVGW